MRRTVKINICVWCLLAVLSAAAGEVFARGLLPQAEGHMVPRAGENLWTQFHANLLPQAGENESRQAAENVFTRFGDNIFSPAGDSNTPQLAENIFPGSGESILPQAGESILPQAGEDLFPKTDAGQLPPAGQNQGQRRAFRVEGGVARAAEARRAAGTEAYTPADSLAADSLGLTLLGLDSLRQSQRLPLVELARTVGDSLAADSLEMTVLELWSIIGEYRTDSVRFHDIARTRYYADSLHLTYEEADLYRQTVETDSLIAIGALAPPDTTAGWSRRQLRRLERELRWNDPEFVPHNRFFKDSIPISRLTAISFAVPGYSQLYNSQYWKIPVLYGTVGTSAAFWATQQKQYKNYKQQYDDYILNNGAARTDELDAIQSRMIKKNTTRQLLMFATIGSYIYFIGDGAVNYPGTTTAVKKATTLSMIFPGAGQVYNRSYWKVPFVLGGFATMAMTIDWNNRGYQRFKLASDMAAASERNGTDRLDEFPTYSADFLRKIKKSYRRNRDLCIILTGAVYLLNVIDAHVDAHMKDYDISDDLSFNFSPVLMNTNSMTSKAGRNTFGMQFSVTF